MFFWLMGLLGDQGLSGSDHELGFLRGDFRIMS